MDEIRPVDIYFFQNVSDVYQMRLDACYNPVANSLIGLHLYLKMPETANKSLTEILLAMNINLDEISSDNKNAVK